MDGHALDGLTTSVNYWATYASGVRANSALFAVVAIYAAASVATAAIVGFRLNINIYNFVTFVFAPFVLLMWFLAGCAVVLLRHRPSRPFRFLAGHIRTWPISRRMAYGLPVVLILPPFMSIFTGMKAAIPTITQFYLDPWAVEADRVLHGGHDAWRLLQPALGYPVVTAIVNFFYNVWFVVLNVVLVVVAFMTGNDRLRAQFLVAFVLTWALLGTVAATLLASVGPCYYSLFYGSNDFADLMTYLRSANEHYPIWALTTQEMLYDSYKQANAQIGSGISAIPSLHVAVATLLAIFAWNVSRAAGIAATAFAAIIAVGSVHLGWHYAVDGYISMIATPPIWWLSGKCVLSRRRGDGDHPCEPLPIGA